MAEKLYPNCNMTMFKANPFVKNGISKLKVLELKDCFKIGEKRIIKELLFQFIIDESEKELIFTCTGSTPYFPFRETEEQAKKDLLDFCEKRIAYISRIIERENADLEKLFKLKQKAQN